MSERDDTPTGAGPGITGASGDFIEGTGEGQGVGGTGHTDDRALAGAEPDERNREPVINEPGAERPESDFPPGAESKPEGKATSAPPEPPFQHRAIENRPGGPRSPVPANDLVPELQGQHTDAGRVEYPRAGNPGSDDEH